MPRAFQPKDITTIANLKFDQRNFPIVEPDHEFGGEKSLEGSGGSLFGELAGSALCLLGST